MATTKRPQIGGSNQNIFYNRSSNNNIKERFSAQKSTQAKIKFKKTTNLNRNNIDSTDALEENRELAQFTAPSVKRNNFITISQ